MNSLSSLFLFSSLWIHVTVALKWQDYPCRHVEFVLHFMKSVIHIQQTYVEMRTSFDLGCYATYLNYIVFVAEQCGRAT